MRQVPGAPTTLFKETQVLWCVKRNKRSKGISSLASCPETHILHHTLPGFLLLQSYLGSIRKCKNAVTFKEKNVCYILGVICQPSALPGWRFHPAPCSILPISSVWSCWLLISNALAQLDVGCLGCRICRRSLSSQPSWGCRREPGHSNTLSALTVVCKFGNDS